VLELKKFTTGHNDEPTVTSVETFDTEKFWPITVSRVPPTVGQLTVTEPEFVQPRTASTVGAIG